MEYRIDHKNFRSLDRSITIEFICYRSVSKVISGKQTFACIYDTDSILNVKLSKESPWKGGKRVGSSVFRLCATSAEACTTAIIRLSRLNSRKLPLMPIRTIMAHAFKSSVSCPKPRGQRGELVTIERPSVEEDQPRREA